MTMPVISRKRCRSAFVLTMASCDSVGSFLPSSTLVVLLLSAISETELPTENRYLATRIIRADRSELEERIRKTALTNIR